MSLKDRVEEFVGRCLAHYSAPRIRGPKAIHGAVWGTNLFHPHEIAVLDTPLLQRLRRIYQTGLCFLTFPSATHTRFEHVLGVAVMATRFVRKVNRKSRFDEPLIKPDPARGELASIRMAALLHDVGHGFSSHISEQLYQWRENLQEFLKRDRFSGKKPSEVLSYLIVTSGTFKKWFKTNILDVYREEDVGINLDHVGDLIIGAPPAGKKKRGFAP